MENKLAKLEKARAILQNQNLIVFTMDVDWASEYAIAQTLNYFENNEIPLTVFLTHKSKVCTEALRQGKIKGGIHPNFLPDSSQGKNFNEVIEFCYTLLPEVRGFRAHRYFDLNDTIDELYKRGVLYESNLCTWLDRVSPFLHRSGMVGFPIFMEDGGYLYQNGSLDYSNLRDKIHMPGLKVINFHPMHFMINTPYFTYTRDIKDRLSREEYNNLDAQSFEKLKYGGRGISDLLKNIIADIKGSKIETAYMDDVYNWIMDL